MHRPNGETAADGEAVCRKCLNVRFRHFRQRSFVWRIIRPPNTQYVPLVRPARSAGPGAVAVSSVEPPNGAGSVHGAGATAPRLAEGRCGVGHRTAVPCAAGLPGLARVPDWTAVHHRQRCRAEPRYKAGQRCRAGLWCRAGPRSWTGLRCRTGPRCRSAAAPGRPEPSYSRRLGLPPPRIRVTQTAPEPSPKPAALSFHTYPGRKISDDELKISP